jgi:hypothetical protein
MAIIPNNLRSDNARSIVTGTERNSAQALRPTFGGWGPRI